MKKYVLSVLLAATSLLSAQAQLVYKVSGKGLEKPSYIVGTHHLAPVAMVDQLPAVREALTNADQVYGELDMNVLNSTANKERMEQAMLLPADKSLMGLLTKEQGQRLDNLLKELMGVGMSNPQVGAKMNRMRPMAMLTNLTLLSYLRNHMGEFDATANIDSYFQKQAQVNNMPVSGLETLDYQLEVLYKSRTLEREVEMLMCFVDNLPFYETQAEDMTEAYKKHDLNKLLEVMKTSLSNTCDMTKDEWNILIDNRNADWALRMPAIMQASPTLFAVGVGHLPGEKGVLQLLKDAGYTVEAVQ